MSAHSSYECPLSGAALEERLTSREPKLTIKQLGPVEDDMSARADESILLLPLNWQSAENGPLYSASTESVAKLFSQEGVVAETLSPLTAETNLKDERAMDWVAPTLLVSSLLVSQNSMAVSLALSVMANYVTDLFKGIRSDPNVKLTVIQTEQRGKTAREIHYEGPASGLSALTKVLSSRELKD